MIIIGCDLHTRMPPVAMLDRERGELVEKRLDIESGEARRFYEGLKEGALVGIESTGSTRWFAEMLAGLRARAGGGRSGEDPGEGSAPAEARPAGRGADSGPAGAR